MLGTRGEEEPGTSLGTTTAAEASAMTTAATNLLEVL